MWYSSLFYSRGIDIIFFKVKTFLHTFFSETTPFGCRKNIQLLWASQQRKFSKFIIYKWLAVYLLNIKYPQTLLGKWVFLPQLNSDAKYKEKLIAGTTVAASLAQLPKRPSALWVNCTSAILNTTGQMFTYTLGFLRSLAVFHPKQYPRMNSEMVLLWNPYTTWAGSQK